MWYKRGPHTCSRVSPPKHHCSSSLHLPVLDVKTAWNRGGHSDRLLWGSLVNSYGTPRAFFPALSSPPTHYSLLPREQALMASFIPSLWQELMCGVLPPFHRNSPVEWSVAPSPHHSPSFPYQYGVFIGLWHLIYKRFTSLPGFGGQLKAAPMGVITEHSGFLMWTLTSHHQALPRDISQHERIHTVKWNSISEMYRCSFYESVCRLYRDTLLSVFV